MFAPGSLSNGFLHFLAGVRISPVSTSVLEAVAALNGMFADL
jgi:hypothetical protein